MNNKEIAQNILAEVGGKQNVESVTHCITRLRFILNDFTLPDKEKISNLDGVISVLVQGGQFQVVVGNKVNDIYSEVKQELGDIEVPSASKEKTKRSVFDTFTSTISGIFTPVLGPLAASGTIKGILAILQISNLLSETSGTYQILYALSNAFFYFMPILLGASAAKYFKMNTYVGMIIGASMVYPSLIPYASEGKLDFLSIPVNMMDYTSSVFPAIIAVWLASKLDKLAQRFPLKDLSFIIQPLFVLLVTVPVSLIVIGPIISTLSGWLAIIVNNVYNFNPILGGAVIGGPWIIMVMFGLHWAFIPIFINNIATQGLDPVMGLLLANQFAMAGAAFAVGLKTRNEKLKTLSFSTGATTLIGVSEPTLYGVLLPYKRPLIAAVIGGSIGAMIAGAAHTVQYAFGGSGFLGIPLIINTSGIDAGFYGGVASQVVGFVAAFIITYLWGFKDKETDDAAQTHTVVENSSVNETISINNIVSGEIIPLSEVTDKVFSEGMLGQGLAVRPLEGKFYAPFDGIVTTVFPTKHAIGLTSLQGVELLIHVGVDTVELNGKFFKTFVNQGDKVKTGDLILEADLKAISDLNYSTITPIVITNTDSFSSVTTNQNEVHVMS
jgi:PTS system beta-glucosides-specific IIC component